MLNINKGINKFNILYEIKHICRNAIWVSKCKNIEFIGYKLMHLGFASVLSVIDLSDTDLDLFDVDINPSPVKILLVIKTISWRRLGIREIVKLKMS